MLAGGGVLRLVRRVGARDVEKRPVLDGKSRVFNTIINSVRSVSDLFGFGCGVAGCFGESLSKAAFHFVYFIAFDWIIETYRDECKRRNLFILRARRGVGAWVAEGLPTSFRQGFRQFADSLAFGRKKGARGLPMRRFCGEAPRQLRSPVVRPRRSARALRAVAVSWSPFL